MQLLFESWSQTLYLPIGVQLLLKVGVIAGDCSLGQATCIWSCYAQSSNHVGSLQLFIFKTVASVRGNHTNKWVYAVFVMLLQAGTSTAFTHLHTMQSLVWLVLRERSCDYNLCHPCMATAGMQGGLQQKLVSTVCSERIPHPHLDSFT